jgi:hypothetical protein
VNRDEARGERRSGIVVRPVADVGDLPRRSSGELDESLEEPGVRLVNPETRGANDHVDVERLARPSLHRGALVAGDPDEQAGRPQALEAVERVGVEILERVGDPVRHRRSLEAEVPPELPVLLAPFDRLPERGPQDMRAETCGSGVLAPVTLLVDEGFPDVEEDRTHPHGSLRSSNCSTRSRSAAVVTFARRGSPSTTATLPPCRSTSDAQSVAPARSAA